MREKSRHIPINTLPSGTREGIIIARTSFNGLPDAEEAGRSHRDNGHLFILQEKGTTHIEIDFREYKIKAASLIYIHPSQVHRLIAFKNATVSSWIITSENLQPEFLDLLEGLTPAAILALDKDTQELISTTASLCITFSERVHEKLYDPVLKESCNTLVALVISQYLKQSNTHHTSSRFEEITKAFKALLEKDFKSIKTPAAYAKSLNISTSYLNECVKSTTGSPVSDHIQQRVILEARRLLYHSSNSVKEIAAELGYDDYSYFTRLFVKLTDMTPSVFRNKNRD